MYVYIYIYILLNEAQTDGTPDIDGVDGRLLDGREADGKFVLNMSGFSTLNNGCGAEHGVYPQTPISMDLISDDSPLDGTNHSTMFSDELK